MPNLIGSDGIQVKTYAEIVAALNTAFQTIYGADVNLDQNSPDGQLINILALIIMDQGDLIVQDYDSKDPDQAVGVALDGVSQLCGIARKGGTYTKVVVTVKTDRAINLDGLDTSTTPYTVEDADGNQFQLIESESLTTGNNNLDFQAKNIGVVQISANTLIIPTTVILGILSVNNAAVPYADGVDQESDAAFRIRRAKSVAVPAQGLLNALRGGLFGLDGLNDAVVYENTDPDPDTDGIPGHGIWVITDGGVTADIAGLIYKYRPPGIPMKGSTTSTVSQVDGSIIVIQFDEAVDQDLYVQMDVESLSGGTIDEAALKAALVATWTFGIYQEADITTLNVLVRKINPDVVVKTSGVSLTPSDYEPLVLPTYKYNKFVLTTGHITFGGGAPIQ